ncbi:MAG: thiosulfate oxidation carrier complex protein SoxZ [Candidatus Thiodiazotropha endolucinida]
MMNDQVHVKVPRIAKMGEVVRIMTKLNHPMESGWRRRQNGEIVPKDLIRDFSCQFNGAEVFKAEFDSGTAGNPYLSFFVRINQSGHFRFIWSGQNGERFYKEADIEVG